MTSFCIAPRVKAQDGEVALYSLYFGRNLCKSYKDLPFWKFLVVTYCKFGFFGVYLYRKEVSPMIHAVDSSEETQNECARRAGELAAFFVLCRTADKTII